MLPWFIWGPSVPKSFDWKNSIRKDGIHIIGSVQAVFFLSSFLSISLPKRGKIFCQMMFMLIVYITWIDSFVLEDLFSVGQIFSYGRGKMFYLLSNNLISSAEPNSPLGRVSCSVGMKQLLRQSLPLTSLLDHEDQSPQLLSGIAQAFRYKYWGL